MKILLSITLSIICVFSSAQTYDSIQTENMNLMLFKKHQTTCIYLEKNEQPVVYSALAMLQNDVKTVFDADLQLTDDKDKAQIIISSSNELQGKWETFQIDTQNNKLYISGSDARGKAYGILELSRMIGVSPWVWWADVTPKKRDVFLLSEINKTSQSPSVEYRGIFLNDEDWGLLPWAIKHFEYKLIDGVKLSDNPRWKGAIAPQCYEKIFQLLLRLRANTIWPAMHECTVPFYFVKGNREMAEKYGIVVGTSHCEPLMRNSASEWDVSGKGDYNFITNRQNVLDYWAERLEELKNSENIFTIGMRGKHDGMMQGVKTLDEHKNALSQIIPAQQELLLRHSRESGNPSKQHGIADQARNDGADKIPQVFIPYKEVLDVYDSGLNVPDYVTLVWCDDNYGYIRRLSNEKEQLREGGAGVYYHVSYWGQPHDYLWLASTSPALIYTEMKRAYEHNAKKLWILNVGDIKPAEYLTEFFLDMAWNSPLQNGEGLGVRLEKWAEREFGKQNADAVASVMKEYYRLANIRKPEFMGWSRVEEPGYGRGGITPVKDSEYNPSSNNELQCRIDDYLKLEKQVANIKKSINPNLSSAFFQLVEYPVRCASLINQKLLYKQLSNYVLNMGNTEKAKLFAAKSLNAYTIIDTLTNKYNSLENGKWNGIMDSHPRDLPVFVKPEFPQLDSLADDNPIGMRLQEQEEYTYISAQNADNATNLKTKGIEGLGHSFSAIKMQKGETLDFIFDIPEAGEYNLKIGTLPNHDVDGAGMKIEVFINDKPVIDMDYSVKGRSEEWKRNVLRGQTISSTALNIEQTGKVKISIKALTENIILDQIMLMQGKMDFYEFPVKRYPSHNDYQIGADLSFLKQAEDNGFQFKENGEVKPGMKIFADHGYNWIRLRLMHTPSAWTGRGKLPNDLEYTIATAQEAKKYGMKFLLDYHYSDTWADPGKQNIPAAWVGKNQEDLVKAVYDYTLETMRALAEAGVYPDMVQVGNEITNGMLWPNGKISENPQGFIELLRAAVNGVLASVGPASKPPRIMIHIDKGGDKAATKAFFDRIIAAGIPFDVIGQSYYPWWQGTLADLRENLNFTALEYDKDIIVVEMAYNMEPSEYVNKPAPYPESPEGQVEFVNAVHEAVMATPNHRGIGVYWWEPATSRGGGRTYFDREGNVQPVIHVFDRYTTGFEDKKAYLFSYFTGQNDGLKLAYSYDGLTWTALNDGQSFLKPVVGNDKLMRDPSILQAPDGTFHAVWTTGWTDRFIGYASSKDLIHWSEQQAIPVMMHEPTAHNCWAPELFYDEPSKMYYIIWATTIPGRHKEVATRESEKGLNHRIYYVTTKDFHTFSETKMFFNPDFSVIDASIVKIPNTQELLMVVKNENSNPPEKNLRVTRTKNITDGFPTDVSAPITGNYWAEGPSPLFIGDTLYVYFDKYRDHRYGAVRSLDNGKTWDDVSDRISFPAGTRHGTAFAVDASVVENLIANQPDSAYIKPFATDKNNNKNGLHIMYSIDKEHWTVIGNEFSFLKSDYGPWGSDKRMLNPHVFLSEEGVWTCRFRVNEKDSVMGITQSNDLIHWKPQDYFLGKNNGLGEAISEPQDESFKVPWKFVENLLNHVKLTEYKNQLYAETAVQDSDRFANLKNVEVKLVPDFSDSKKISDKLIGVFFEDINYAADGGLYAELLQNRDFEYSSADRKEWNATTAWKTDNGILTIDNKNPLHPNNSHYAVLENGQTIINEGWDGIPLIKGEKYNFSVFAKTESSGKFIIKLIDSEGNTVSNEVPVKINSKNWKKYSAVLIPTHTVPDAKLSILNWLSPDVVSRFSIHADMFSLFPQKTFKNHKNGLRVDLAQTIADIKPKFVRFPGGCLVHGDGIENMYRWKNSVGKLEERKPDRNIWGYHQTKGLGYFEFFQFCEDIGAEPFPVLAAGVPCQNSRKQNHALAGQQGGIPLDEMDAYIQDILDLIEWANGDQSTKWGKVRADAGHPKPFNLKYIGIGNEDLISEVFKERFEMIFKVIKTKHPEITVIGTVGPFYEGSDYDFGWEFASKIGVPMVDEHYYVTPGWMIYNQDYYDNYDRNKPKVYLGEYAAHATNRANNIESALAEALYLCNVERNGDIVTMTSYAPLLAKEGHTQWNPDLIYFNNTDVKPTVNYYIQKLFGENTGDIYINNAVHINNDNPKVCKRIACSIVQDSRTNDIFLKIVNLLPVPVTVNMDAKIFSADSKLTKTVLCGRPDAKNVHPEESFITQGELENMKVPEYSFTVIRIKDNNDKTSKK